MSSNEPVSVTEIPPSMSEDLSDAPQPARCVHGARPELRPVIGVLRITLGFVPSHLPKSEAKTFKVIHPKIMNHEEI